MKKICLMLLLIFMISPSVRADAKSTPQPILYTYYRQMGWGDRVEIGYIDSNGDCWMLAGSDSEIKWPDQPDEQIQYLTGHSFAKTDTIDYNNLFEMKSLIFAVTPSNDSSHPVANDAGIERTYAVRYDKDGFPDPVLLGMSGDDMLENTDPNAQGLYLAARRQFPYVTAYGGNMGPAGFQPEGITAFCNLGDLTGATVKAVFIDCEAGPSDIVLSRDDQNNILSFVSKGVVTGKVNAIGTTGGFRTYSFFRDSIFLGSIDICDGLLYRSDGMYSIEAG